MFRSMKVRLTVVLALIAVLVVACGDDESTDSSDDPVSVAEAIDAEGSVRVTGYVFVMESGDVVLAELLGESFPPQPLGASIVVEGLNLDDLDLETAPADSEISTSRWTNDSVTLSGSMVDGVLTEAGVG